MKTLTITAARRHFGTMLDAAQHEPVLIRRRNRDEVVIISTEEYARIRGSKSRRGTIKTTSSWKSR